MDTHRYIARLILEAETPLFVGSGAASLLKDALVQKDTNGFPMIQGTSLAGVLRNAFAEINPTLVNTFFGSDDSKNTKGSLLKVSSAYLLLNNNKISEGIISDLDEALLSRFSDLPTRQHVRISDKGTAVKNGLYDNEVVFKGTRFMFEIELRGNHSDEQNWNQILELIKSPTFRLGSGTRNGYGNLKVISMFTKLFDLKNLTDFEAYLNFDPSFNSNLKWEVVINTDETSERYTKFNLALKPDSFFIFSEGFGDDEADNRPLEEDIVVYANGKMDFQKQTVIPASSIKGAIAHRVAFHYNKIKQQFADENNGTIGNANLAVTTLFGKAGKDVKEAEAGNIFINDFYFTKDEIANNKIFNHVAIDRFTGGAVDGALFSEKVTNLVNGKFEFNIFVKNEALKDNEVQTALVETLKDVCKGLLPLGGMTTKGHGMFTGKLVINGEEQFDYNNKETTLCL